MRWIQKSNEPQGLLAFRKTTSINRNYETLPSDVKNELRTALVRDQGGLCCYCMGRIRDHAVAARIEHWKSQAAHTDEDSIAWPNLLAACLGNEGSGLASQHCDVRKGDSAISISPLVAAHIKSLTYCNDGRIQSSNSEWQKDIDTTLNLNHATLRNNRKSSVHGMIQQLVKETKGSEFNRNALESALSRCNARDRQGDYPEYAEALAFWLRRRIQRIAAVP